MTQNVIQSTTQRFLEIHDITSDLLLLKSGGSALVITVNAINFGLLAEEEQDGIIYAYASLLNSLNYPIQIVIRSQTKDVTSYLQLLQEQEEKSQDKLKRKQIAEYRTFVGNLIQERNVLDKKFYVVIPASPLEMGVVSAESVVPGVKAADISTFEKSVILEKAKNILEPKRDHLIAQFGRIGLFARQLKTQEIIQLFYNAYNPEASEGQNLTNSKNYTTPLVRPSVQGVSMADMQQPPTPTPTSPQPAAQGAPQAGTPAPTTPVGNLPQQPTPATAPTVPGATPAPTPPTTPAAPTTPQPATPAPAKPAMPTPGTPAPKKPLVTPEAIIDATETATSETPTPAASTAKPIPMVETTGDPSQVQKEIDSTLQQIGAKPGETPTPPTPGATPTPPTAGTGIPTPPTPAVSQPTQSPAGQQDKTMPELPEI